MMDWRSEAILEAMSTLDKIWPAGVAVWVQRNRPKIQSQIDFAESRLDKALAKDDKSMPRSEFKLIVDAWKSAHINALNSYRREHK